MIALDQIVAPLPVDMSDAIEMRIITLIDFANDTPIGWRLIGHNGHRLVQPNAFDRLFEKGSGGFCIPPGREPEIDQLAVCINSTPKVAPFSADADVGLIHVPIYAGAAEMLFGTLGQFGTEFLDPSKYG